MKTLKQENRSHVFAWHSVAGLSSPAFGIAAKGPAGLVLPSHIEAKTWESKLPYLECHALTNSGISSWR
jgi:hypothetical protein